MRQMQKVQLIIASSAILFCLSPISHWLGSRHTQVTVHYQANAQENRPNRHEVNEVNSNSPPLPLVTDANGSMRWFRTTIGHEDRQIFALTAGTDKLYPVVAQAVAIATPIVNVHELDTDVKFPFMCYFYTKDGAVASAYRLSSTGLLKNLKTGIVYEPAAAFVDVAREVTHVKESSS